MKKIISITFMFILLFTGCAQTEPTTPKEIDSSIESTSSAIGNTTAEDTPENENIPDESVNKPLDDITSKNENAEQSEIFDIDINKCIDDLKAGLPLEPDYTFVKDYAILADGKNLTISIVVDDSTDPEKALDFADTVVRQLNLYANMQDSNVELGNKDFYGGLYTEYTALVGVAPYSKMNNTDEWFVYDAIVGGKVMLKLQ